MRLAATVSTDAEAEEFRSFLDAQRIAEVDRVIRRIALRRLRVAGRRPCARRLWCRKSRSQS